MGIKVNSKELEKQLAAQSKRINEGLPKVLNAYGFNVVREAKRLAPADEGLLRNSISHEVKGDDLEIISSANYAAFMEFGTRKFAAQYVATLPANWQSYAATFKGRGGAGGDLFKAIQQWVKNKGIEPSAAYPIALKILRDGVKAHPFLYPAINSNIQKLEKDIQKLIS